MINRHANKIIIFIILGLAAGCSHAPTTGEQRKQTEGATGRSEKEEHTPPAVAAGMGTVAPTATPAPRDVYGPLPKQARGVVLVLGPGGARTFAHLGVIKELVANKIPIAAVMGVDLGALFACGYGYSGSINDMEWMILGFQKEPFEQNKEKNGLKEKLISMVEGDSKGRQLDAMLKKAFQDKILENSKIPVQVGFVRASDHRSGYFDSGKIREILRVALSFSEYGIPAIFCAPDVLCESGAEHNPFPVTVARTMAAGPVIVINPLPELFPGLDSRVEEELTSAELVLVPKLADIPTGDFDRRREAVLRGKQAVQGELPKIKKLVFEPAAGEANK